jgi:hypothetical protein
MTQQVQAQRDRHRSGPVPPTLMLIHPNKNGHRRELAAERTTRHVFASTVDGARPDGQTA